MGIKIENAEDKTTLCIDGELTIYTAQEYKNSIAESFVADKLLELDISGVEEIDTSGLQILAAIGKELTNNGCEMKIVSTSDVAKEAFEISRLMSDLKCNKEEKKQ